MNFPGKFGLLPDLVFLLENCPGIIANVRKWTFIAALASDRQGTFEGQGVGEPGIPLEVARLGVARGPFEQHKVLVKVDLREGDIWTIPIWYFGKWGHFLEKFEIANGQTITFSVCPSLSAFFPDPSHTALPKNELRMGIDSVIVLIF